MNRDKFITYLESPGNLDKGNLEEIRGILDEYPYFQTAHMLFVKTLNNLQDVRFSNQLKFSAAHVGDRHILFNLVNQPGIAVRPQTGSPGRTEIDTITEPDRDDVPESLADKVMRDIEDMKKAKAQTSGRQADHEAPGKEKSVSFDSGSLEEREDIPEDAVEKVDSAGTEARDVLVIDEKADIEEASGRQAMNADNSRQDEVFADLNREGGQDLLELDKPPNLPGTESKADEAERADKKEISEKKNAPPAADLKSESYSFAEWLDMFQSDPAVLAEERIEQVSAPDNSSHPDNSDNEGGEDNPAGTDLIDRFLREKPRIEPRSPLEDEPPPADMSEKSTREIDEFFTETLARVYVQQKHYRKAIYAYEKLCLKYPEKYSYFADRIDEIKRMVNH